MANIKNILNFNIEELNKLSPEERKLALQILREYSEQGKSKKLDDLKYADYEEIPVDIITFMDDPQYLGTGLINPETGKSTVFPYWRDLAQKIYSDNIEPANYNTLALSGSIGLGKSFIAVVLGLYDLYRTLCLKDPYAYYGLQQIDLITYAFINITIDAARGVAWDKCQQLLQSSPWFMSHGTLEGRTNIEWVPPKGIELIAGSQSRHIIGRAVKWCLDGDTIIKTSVGDFTLKELEESKQGIKVFTLDNYNNLNLSNNCFVQKTAESLEEIIITLEDGSEIKCTPNHLLMLKDGSYKEAQLLTEKDELMELPEDVSYFDFIDSIITSRGQWNIPEGEYFEAHHIIPKCVGGEGNLQRNGRGKNHPNIIHLYPEEHYKAHRLLALENPKNVALLWAWDAMAYNKKEGRNYFVSEKDYGELKRLHSQWMKENRPFINPETGKNYNFGKSLSGETKQKISTAKIGKSLPKSLETRAKISKSNVGKHNNFQVAHKDKKAIYNPNLEDSEILWIHKDEDLPENYIYGLNLDPDRDNSGYINGWTEERRKEASKKWSGKNNPHYGIHKNYGTGMAGKKHREESNRKHSETLKNRSEEKKILDSERKSKALLGKKKSNSFKSICTKNSSKYIYIINNIQLYGKNELINYIKNNYNIKINDYDIDNYFNSIITVKMKQLNIQLGRLYNENYKNSKNNS